MTHVLQHTRKVHRQLRVPGLPLVRCEDLQDGLEHLLLAECVILLLVLRKLEQRARDGRGARAVAELEPHAREAERPTWRLRLEQAPDDARELAFWGVAPRRCRAYL